MPAILPPSGSTSGPFHPLDTSQQLTAGNDAKVADGTALVWVSAKWPDLAGATLAFVVGHDRHFSPFSGLPLTWTGTVPTLPDSPSAVSLEVPAAESLNLPEGQYDYVLTATLLSADKVTLAIGKLTVYVNPGTVPLFPSA